NQGVYRFCGPLLKVDCSSTRKRDLNAVGLFARRGELWRWLDACLDISHRGLPGRVGGGSRGPQPTSIRTILPRAIVKPIGLNSRGANTNRTAPFTSAS